MSDIAKQQANNIISAMQEEEYWGVVRRVRKLMAESYKRGEYRHCIVEYQNLLRLGAEKCPDWDWDEEYSYCREVRHDLHRDLSQAYLMAGDFKRAVENARISLNLEFEDEKCILIALKSAAGLKNWFIFTDVVIHCIKEDGMSDKVRNQVFQDWGSLSPEQREWIYEQFSPETKIEWMKNYNKWDIEIKKEKQKEMMAASTFTFGAANTSVASSSKALEKKPDPKTIEKKPDSKTAPDAAINNKHEKKKLEKYEGICKEAAEAHQRRNDSLQLFEIALGIARELNTLKKVSDLDIVLIQFLISNVQIESLEYVKISSAVSTLKTINNQDNIRKLPAIYVTLARAFFLLNRFAIAKEWIGKGKSFIEKGILFSKQCYPATNITILVTTREAISEALEKLHLDCSQFHPPDAVCCYDICEQINSHHIAPLKDIYFRDPDFEGFVSLSCNNKCELFYHPSCWKHWKTKVSTNSLKLVDERVVGRGCITPDCDGLIKTVKHIGKDGQVKSKKEAAAKVEVKPVQSDVPKTKKSKISGVENKISSPSNNKEFVDKKPVKINRKSSTEALTLPSSFYKATTKNIKTQTDDKTTSEKYSQTVSMVDETAAKLRQTELELKSTNKKHEKLRQKYLELKDREADLKNLVSTTWDAERENAQKIWKTATDMLIDNWISRYCERTDILRLIKNNVSFLDVQMRVDERLKQWLDSLKLVTKIRDEIARESLISATALLKLPQLPPFPPNDFPALQVIDSLTKSIDRLSQEVEQVKVTMPESSHLVASSTPPSKITATCPPDQPFRNEYEDTRGYLATGGGGILGSSPTPSEIHLPTDGEDKLSGNGLNFEVIGAMEDVNGSELDNSDIIDAPDLSDSWSDTDSDSDDECSFENSDVDGNDDSIYHSTARSRLQLLKLARSNESQESSGNTTPVNPLPVMGPPQPQHFLPSMTTQSVSDTQPMMPSFSVTPEYIPPFIDPSTQITTVHNPSAALMPPSAVTTKIDEISPQSPNNSVPFFNAQTPSTPTKMPPPTSSRVALTAPSDQIIMPQDSAASVPTLSDYYAKYLNPQTTKNDNQARSARPSPVEPVAFSPSDTKFISQNPFSVLMSPPLPTAKIDINSPQSAKKPGPSVKMPTPTTPTKKHPPMSPLASPAPRSRLDSFCSVSSVDSIPVVTKVNVPKESIYSRLMNFIFTQPQFSSKSEDEIRRCLEALRTENRSVFISTPLPDILTMLNVKLQEKSSRRVLLHKFSGAAWGTTTAPPKPRPKLSIKKVLGDCPICFESLNGRTDILTLSCTHVYHYHCLQQWIKTDRTCPLCREYVLPPDEFPALS